MSQVKTDFQPRPVRKRGEMRRAALLDAATEVFLEKGYEGTSLSDIVTRAGGSRRMIYDQFRDKEGLFEEMMALRCSQILEPLDNEGLKHEEPRVALHRIGTRFLEVMTSTSVQSLRRIVTAEGKKFPRIAQIFFETGYDATIEGVRQYFDGLSATQGLYFDDPFMTAIMFLSMVQGDAIDRLTANGPNQRSPEMLSRQIELATSMVLASARRQ